MRFPSKDTVEDIENHFPYTVSQHSTIYEFTNPGNVFITIRWYNGNIVKYNGILGKCM